MVNSEGNVQTVKLDEGDHGVQSIKILAWDYSGSTSGNKHYHKLGKKYLNDFVKQFHATPSVDDENKPIYLTWESRCKDVKLENLRKIAQEKKGTGGTCPSELVKWIKENIDREKAIELWLITDGEIGPSELKQCSSLNRDVNYSNINFIVINQRKINMSVGTSFFRAAKLRIFDNDSLYKQINTATPFDYDSITLKDFESQWKILSDFIQAKFMGSDIESLEEVEKLSALRRRLLKSVDDEYHDQKNETSTVKPDFSSRKRSDLLAALKSCQFYKSLVVTDVREVREKIDASVSSLINYIHDKHRSLNFESLKVEYKQSKIDDIEEKSEPNLGADELEKCVLFDAVTLENEENVPVLLISVTDLIQKYWLDGNFTKFRALMDCPLLANVDDCIGHVYTYSTFKSLYASVTGTMLNPLTNEPANGLIFDKAADGWNDYVLATSFFQGKKVQTCPALWYYIIWKSAKNKPWIESAVVDMLRSYALRRLASAKVKLAFGRLPLDPKEFVPVHVACYYCAEGSTLLFGEDSTLFGEERLRKYWPIAESMLDILDFFGYEEVDKAFVMKRAKLFEIMTDLKRIPQEMEKRYYLMQNVFESQGQFLIPVIKDKKSVGFVNVLQYHHSTSMIPFNFDESPVDITSWLLLTYDKPAAENLELCLNTFRPFFLVKTDSSDLVPNYSQLFTHITDIVLDCNGEILQKSVVTKLNQSKLISGYKLYIDLTTRLKRFPTFEEYSTYTWKKKKFNGSKVRLFNTQIMSNIQEVFHLYAKLGVDVAEFIEKTKNSVSISNRIKMEKNSMDENIKKFIDTAKDMLVKELPTVSEQMAELKAQNKGKTIPRNPKRINRNARKTQKSRNLKNPYSNITMVSSSTSSSTASSSSSSTTINSSISLVINPSNNSTTDSSIDSSITTGSDSSSTTINYSSSD